MLFYTRVDYTEDENESLLKEMALLSIGKIHIIFLVTSLAWVPWVPRNPLILGWWAPEPIHFERKLLTVVCDL